MDSFLFVDLASLTPGKPFAGFAAGSFTDMNGRAVEFKPSQLKTFIDNTKAAITLAISKGMPGLPIDARQHDKGDAAGWITDAIQGEVPDNEGKKMPVIMLNAEWTALGLELLKSRVQTNFSPTVDLRGQVIRGGSLTNWPASVDEHGSPLFPAIELAQGMRSLDQQIMRVRRAWDSEKYEGLWVLEVFPDHCIVGSEGDAKEPERYKVLYGENEDGSIGFQPEADWEEVEQAWVPTDGGEDDSDNAEGMADLDAPNPQGDLTMELTREELAELIATQVREALAGQLQQAATPGGAGTKKEPLDVLAFLEMSGAADDVVGAFKQNMLDQYELMKQQATQEAAEMITRIRREADVAELTQTVVNGSAEVPYGLPIDGRDLQEFLGHLNPSDYAFAKKLLTELHAKGRTPFAELGHGRINRVLPKLEAPYDSYLKDHMKAGGDVEEWFQLSGLGEAADFDLSAFKNGVGE